MYCKTKTHSGTMANCKTCTPIQKKKREKFDRKPRHEGKGSLENYIRRQMAEEIGEAELSKDHKFQIMQHYGIIAPRIDRRVTKPSWMEKSKWQILKQEFHKATRGLVPQSQSQARPTSHPITVADSQRSSKPWREINHKRYNGPKPVSNRRPIYRPEI